jgi:hypothetical protein
VTTPRVVLLLCALSTIQIQAGQEQPAVPVEPISAILDAFRTRAVVALGEGTHNNEQGHAFRLALIRDPRFIATVNDIVVEFGNSRYQDVMDRFVAGETVPDITLRRVWQDTTQAHTVWDVPIYEEFFRAVRALNASIPRERQLRILLGDPPFDWDSVHTREDMGRQIRATGGPGGRDRFAADLIQREVLAKHRRALLVFGDMHLLRLPVGPFPTIVTLLGAAAQPNIFTIWTHTYGDDLRTVQANAATWRVPSLATIKGTSLGAADFKFYYPFPLARPSGDRAATAPQSPRMEDEFDAVLYLGAPSTLTRARIARSLCADTAYMEMRLSRMAFTPAPPRAPNPGDALKEYCGSVTSK